MHIESLYVIIIDRVGQRAGPTPSVGLAEFWTLAPPLLAAWPELRSCAVSSLALDLPTSQVQKVEEQKAAKRDAAQAKVDRIAEGQKKSILALEHGEALATGGKIMHRTPGSRELVHFG